MKSNLIKSLKKGMKYTEGSGLIFENLKLEGTNSKKELTESVLS
jgi:hypothetical protein